MLVVKKTGPAHSPGFFMGVGFMNLLKVIRHQAFGKC